MANHIAILNAYALKDGGFRGVFFVRATKTRHASEVCKTMEQAKFWAKSQAHTAYEEVGYSLAAIRKKGEYLANVWVAA